MVKGLPMLQITVKPLSRIERAGKIKSLISAKQVHRFASKYHAT
jgi:hypothetical protein